MENEIMNTEFEVMEEEETTNAGSGKSIGLGVLIGSLLTAAVIAGGKKLKKVVKNHKARKADEEVDFDDCFEEEDDIVEDVEEES